MKPDAKLSWPPTRSRICWSRSRGGDPFGAAVCRLRSGDEWMSWAACRSPSTCPGLLAAASSPRLPPPVAKASANAAANESSLLDPAGYPGSAAEFEGAASRLTRTCRRGVRLAASR